MTKREMIKMLNNYHKNKVCINLKSLMRTIRNDKINSEIYKVNKLYVHLIYGKRKAEKVYEDMNNIEVRVITKLLIYSYIFILTGKEKEFICICKKIMLKALT